MKTPLLTSALLVGLSLASSKDAYALSRTVNYDTTITNLDKGDVYVSVVGFPGPEYSLLEQNFPDQGDLVQDAAVTEFDQTTTRTLIRVKPGQSRAVHISEKISGGHTRHYHATFFTKDENGQFVAYARHLWKTKVNLRGVLVCDAEGAVDPDRHLHSIHRRTETKISEGEFFKALALGLVPRKAKFLATSISPSPPDITNVLTKFLGPEVLNAVVPGLGTAFATGLVVGETFIKNAPGTCASQIWNMPSIPPEESGVALQSVGRQAPNSYRYIGDFNGDGSSDILEEVLIGKDGLFQGTTISPPSKENPGGVFTSNDWQIPSTAEKLSKNNVSTGGYNWVGDFDGDGVQDLASAIAGNIFVRTAKNKFATEVWPVTNQWGSAGYTWAADFNGDGLTDIATAYGPDVFMKLSTMSTEDPNESKLTTTPASGFRSVKWPTGVNKWGGAKYTFPGDFNGDGLPDIVSIDTGIPGGVHFHMRLNRAATSEDRFAFETWLPARSDRCERPKIEGDVDCMGDSSYTHVADVNGDGLTDIVSILAGDIHRYINVGNNFVLSTTRVENKWGPSQYTYLADFDGDGRADLGTVLFDAVGGRTLRIYRSVGTNPDPKHPDVHRFDPTPIDRLLPIGAIPNGAFPQIGDFNGDGRADILVAHSSPTKRNVVFSQLDPVLPGPGVGESTLSPSNVTVRDGGTVTLNLHWKHHERWRALDTLHLRLVDDSGVVLWARFDEEANTFAVHDGSDFTTAKVGSPGEIAAPGGALLLDQSTLTASGVEGPTVDVAFALRLAEGMEGRTFRVEVLATDDRGRAQGFESMGTLVVSSNSTDLEGGCSVGSKRTSGAWTVFALAALAAGRRVRRRRS